ncbi:hypothetical protein GOZ96_22780 [Agrobacterium vitis]|uniref:Restriction alleviation protein, Lar family n=2 Tax=Agrobacterium vitis TaxID=373 RepID=A0A7J4X3G3_AGRVI|nr:hypothetical protein DXT89_16350 [Agrobacterium vitis]MUZ99395.1 hypothetical protein [Agrobacterium vitis]
MFRPRRLPGVAVKAAGRFIPIDHPRSGDWWRTTGPLHPFTSTPRRCPFARPAHHLPGGDLYRVRRRALFVRRQEMTDTLLPCPFCGSTELTIAANQFSWVACAFCAAEGPQVVSISEATKTWNRRAMTAIECGGEAPPVYVVEMEEAPSTALKVLGVVQVCPICDIAGCHHLRSPTPEATAMPQVVIDLVIAAREFWDAHNDLSNESHALDKALEPFSARVPYENEPDTQEAAAGPTNDPL